MAKRGKSRCLVSITDERELPRVESLQLLPAREEVDGEVEPGVEPDAFVADGVQEDGSGGVQRSEDLDGEEVLNRGTCQWVM